MSQKTNKNGLLKRKIISVIFLVSFLFSQLIVPVSQVNAMDINQLAANIVDVTKDISAQIVKVGEGVLKAGIATTLNTFAQSLATATVTGMATGNWGAQPLFFQFPLEDMLQQTFDQVTGDYLDKLSETLKYDVCKPLNVDLDWRFKLALNIIPQQADNSLNLKKPNCTLSKFVDAVNQSFDNISNALRKTFAADCFNEFLPTNITGASNPETNNVVDNAINSSVGSVADYGYELAGALTNFTYDGIKKYYLYDVPSLSDREARASYFTKKATYYKQKKINPKCTSYKTTTDGQPGSYFCKLSEDKNANKTSNCLTNFELNFNFSASVNLKGVCMLDINKSCKSGADCSSGVCLPSVDNMVTTVCSNDQNKLCLTDTDCGSGNTCISYNYSQGSDCISYELPDKINNVYQGDKVKQKKFLTQYKTCYLTQMSAAFKSLLEVGQVPKQKVQEQKIKLGCVDLVDSLLTSGYTKNAAEFYSAYDLHFKKTYWDKGMVLGSENPELYKTVLRSALLAKRGYDDTGKELTSNGDNFLGYIKSKINFFDPFEQALVNCKSVSGSGSSVSIDVGNCTSEDGKDGKVSSNDTSIVDTSTITVYHSDFSDLMMRQGDMDIFGTMFVDSLINPTKLYYMNDNGQYSSVGLRIGNSSKTNVAFLSPDSSSSKITEIKADLVDNCVKNALNQFDTLDWVQLEKNKNFIAEKQKDLAIEVEKKQEILKADVAKSDVKPVSEPVSHEIKSTPGMVTFNLEQSLGSGANMLQPIGDLFIDPIKIFLTTLLSEGSKKLMEGLFSRAFPTNGVDEDLAALDNINTTADATNNATDNNSCSVPGPLAIGSICIVDGKYENGVCQTCYCESRVGLYDSKGTTTYGTCQSKPSSR